MAGVCGLGRSMILILYSPKFWSIDIRRHQRGPFWMIRLLTLVSVSGLGLRRVFGRRERRGMGAYFLGWIHFAVMSIHSEAAFHSDG